MSARPFSRSREERAVIAVAMATNVLVPLNSTMIAVALPDIVADLDVSVAASAALVTAYLVVMAVLQPPAGRLGDRVDRRRVLLVGLAAFAAAAAVAGLAPSLPVLLAARLAQAAAGAFLTPTTMALVRTVVPAERRGRTVGLVGSSTGLAAAVGPALGGVLVAAGGWRTIFLANVPAVLLALVYAAGLLRVPLPAVTEGRVAAAGDPAAPRESLWRRSFVAPAAANGLANLAMYTLLLAVPVLLSRRGIGPASVGLVVSALTAGMAVMSPLGGRLADALGRRRPPVAGLGVAVAVGSLLVVLRPERVPTWTLVLVLAAFGIGLGSSYASLSTAALEAVGAARAGAAAGAYSSVRYVGSIVGSLLLAQLVERSADLRPVFVLVVAGVALAAVAAARVDPWPPA